MQSSFKTIGLIGRQRTIGIVETLQTLRDFLVSRQLSLFIEEETAAALANDNTPRLNRSELGKQCDLIIVVGGDGSLLNAAKVAVEDDKPILGINRGRLGFLADIHPSEVYSKISEILDGQYFEERRFLLTAYENETASPENSSATKVRKLGDALNDIVLLPGEFAHMIEFSIYIDDQFMCTQRADGLIVTTPTGSTAYALSGGGPILHPALDAIALVPMFPHTLSSRPIVVAGKSKIDIEISADNETSPRISCDGEARIAIVPGHRVQINKMPQQLRLVHPMDYNYFQTLRTKLHWGTQY